MERARALFEAIKNKIPVEAKTFEDFERKLRENNSVFVTADIVTAMWGIPKRYEDIVKTDVVDATVYQGFPVRGRTVRFVAYSEFDNPHDTNGNISELVQATEGYLYQLQNKIPGIRVQLNGKQDLRIKSPSIIK